MTFNSPSALAAAIKASKPPPSSANFTVFQSTSLVEADVPPQALKTRVAATISATTWKVVLFKNILFSIFSAETNSARPSANECKLPETYKINASPILQISPAMQTCASEKCDNFANSNPKVRAWCGRQWVNSIYRRERIIADLASSQEILSLSTCYPDY